MTNDEVLTLNSGRTWFDALTCKDPRQQFWIAPFKDEEIHESNLPDSRDLLFIRKKEFDEQLRTF